MHAPDMHACTIGAMTKPYVKLPFMHATLHSDSLSGCMPTIWLQRSKHARATVVTNLWPALLGVQQ